MSNLILYLLYMVSLLFPLLKGVGRLVFDPHLHGGKLCPSMALNLRTPMIILRIMLGKNLSYLLLEVSLGMVHPFCEMFMRLFSNSDK